MNPPPRLRITALELFEAPVALRMPFRFGVVTMTHAHQAWVRAEVALEDGRCGVGGAAEIMGPKWFDKNPALSHEQNIDHLRVVLRLAAQAYLSDAGPDTAFGHFARHQEAHQRAAATRGHNPLLAAYGPALVDRAVLDALCRAAGLGFADAVRANLPGIGGRHPAFAGLDFEAFLAGLRPAWGLHARHTVGLADPITDADVAEPLHDGLPQTLQQVVRRYGHRYFKLKVSGQAEADLARLQAVAAVLDAEAGDYAVTLDGNEQYADLVAVDDLLQRLRAAPWLQGLARRVLFVEQPIARQHAFDADLRERPLPWPVIVDESDGTLDAFVQARACGYRGISSKTCKGVYKSLLNAARCAAWNAEEGTPGRYFMSAEDLTLQPGLALQQDLALVDLIGLTHAERNGHHYVDGMRARPAAEQQAFAAAHPDLYERVRAPDGVEVTRVRLRAGRLEFGSLRGPGYASAVLPDFGAMERLRQPAGASPEPRP